MGRLYYVTVSAVNSRGSSGCTPAVSARARPPWPTRRGRLNVSPHGLPRTFASRLAMAGVDPRTIQGLGGWPSRTSRARPA